MGDIERTTERGSQPQAPQDLGRPVFMPSVDDAEAMRLLPRKIFSATVRKPTSWISLVDGYDAYRLRFGRVLQRGPGRSMTPESRR